MDEHPDKAIEKALVTQLNDKNSIDVRTLVIKVNGGNVVLEGTASSQEIVDKANEIAAAVPGVNSVQNDIELIGRLDTSAPSV